MHQRTPDEQALYDTAVRRLRRHTDDIRERDAEQRRLTAAAVRDRDTALAEAARWRERAEQAEELLARVHQLTDLQPGGSR